MAILAAIGDDPESEKIVSRAYDLAKVYDDTLAVLHVVPEDDFQTHKQAVEAVAEFKNISFTQEEESAGRFAYRVVEQAIADFDYDAVETLGRVGDPATEVLAEAESIKPEYLVIGGKRRSPVGKAIFGSVPQSILLNAECPVVTVMLD